MFDLDPLFIIAWPGPVEKSLWFSALVIAKEMHLSQATLNGHLPFWELTYPVSFINFIRYKFNKCDINAFIQKCIRDKIRQVAIKI